MSIDQLIINQFRNIKSLNLEPIAEINVLYGQNGSGKSSILEAIYFLAFGRSFRTHLVQRIVQTNADSFSIFTLLNKNKEDEIRLGVERTLQGEKKLKLNGEAIHSLVPIAKKIPLILLTTESHRYFHDGPKLRRQWLDWGVFHVEHSFYAAWQAFNKSLKQRNAALKSNLPYSEIEVWDQNIIKYSVLLDQFREHYVVELEPIFHQMLAMMELPKLKLRYVRGWAPDKELNEVLIQDLARDRLSGFTRHGPHRADLLIFADKIPAGDFLSQGQQKLAAYALHLSQGTLLKSKLDQPPIYLMDDLPSELDPKKRALMANILKNLKAQIFITGITLEELSDLVQLEQARMFHVEHSIQA